MNQQELLVSDSDDQKILRRWLQQRFPNISYGQWQKWFRTGQIRCNGKRVKGNEYISTGQKVRIPPFVHQLATHAEKQTNDMSFTNTQINQFKSNILFDFDDFLVINKPSGLSVQGGSNIKVHVDGLLNAIYPDNPPKLVHRLDKHTSGILLVAKTHSMAQKLAHAFASHAMQKEYWAITEGIPRKPHGTIQTLLEKALSGSNMEKMHVSKDESAKLSKTTFKVLSKNTHKRLAFLSLTPHTGRTHQLRVHCEHIQCPILGDKKYNHNTQSKQLHLHAHSITLPQELGGHTFAAPLPSYFEQTLQSYNLQVT